MLTVVPDPADRDNPGPGAVLERLVAAYLDNAAALTPESTRRQSDRGEVLRLQARRLVGDLLGSQYWLRAIESLGKLSPVEVVAVC